MSAAQTKPMALFGGVTEELFEQAYKTGLPATYSFLRRRGVRAELAQDLSQSAWIRVWEYRESFNSSSIRAITAYARTTAYNLLITYLRGHLRGYEPNEVQLSCLRNESRSYGPQYILNQILIQQVLQRLPVRYCSLLCYWSQAEYGEGRKDHASKLALMRAKRRAKEVADGIA